MDLDRKEFDGACHCGAVRFHVKLSDGLHAARRCNCTYCRMRGAAVVTAAVEDLTLLAGEDSLSLYQFNTGAAKHYFCSQCGIHTHSRRRLDPRQLGVNVACLAAVSPFDLEETPVMDGVHHPLDDPEKAGPRYIGVMRFVATP